MMHRIPRNIMPALAQYAIRNISRKTCAKPIGLRETTLTSRLLHYLKTKTSTDIIKAASTPIMNNMPLDLSVLSKNAAHKKITSLDDSFCANICDMDTQSTFRHLEYYMLLAPDRILEYRFYELAIDRLSNCLDFLSPDEILQFMFFIALQKRTKSVQVLLRKCLKAFSEDHIDNLSIEDVCVICNSTFKTSTKITNTRILEKVKSTLNNNLQLMKDPALLITLIKTLRHNRYQNDDILSTITCTVLFNSTYSIYSFSEICHILACYADYLYYDEPMLDLFYKVGVEILRKSDLLPKNRYDNEFIRVKDIKRFLWAYSLLGYKFDEAVFSEVIIPAIKERIDGGEYENDPGSLVDSILYMWILKHQAVDFIPYALCDKNLRLIKETKSRSKQKLNLLLNCLQLENIQLYKKIGIVPGSNSTADLKQQLSQRGNLHRVFNACQQLTAKSEIKKFELECQIPHLHIFGITGYKSKIYKSVFIEVLDNFVCVKNKPGHAFGPMQMKLRLLDDMDQGLIILPSEEIEDLNDTQLEEYLLSEINMVC